MAFFSFSWLVLFFSFYNLKIQMPSDGELKKPRIHGLTEWPRATNLQRQFVVSRTTGLFLSLVCMAFLYVSAVCDRVLLQTIFFSHCDLLCTHGNMALLAAVTTRTRVMHAPSKQSLACTGFWLMPALKYLADYGSVSFKNHGLFIYSFFFLQ
jgi:hypothetical protein